MGASVGGKPSTNETTMTNGRHANGGCFRVGGLIPTEVKDVNLRAIAVEIANLEYGAL